MTKPAKPKTPVTTTQHAGDPGSGLVSNRKDAGAMLLQCRPHRYPFLRYCIFTMMLQWDGIRGDETSEDVVSRFIHDGDVDTTHPFVHVRADEGDFFIYLDEVGEAFTLSFPGSKYLGFSPCCGELIDEPLTKAEQEVIDQAQEQGSTFYVN